LENPEMTVVQAAALQSTTMNVDGALAGPLATAGDLARQLEADGYTGGWTAETNVDPFLPHVLAAEHTTSLELGTAVAVAFARSPMTLAHTAWDLQVQSGGRFILGLGSQIKPHITKRFSMPWSRPAARMRELILAIRAIWDCWRTGSPLQFRGEFYTHTLMTPFFAPHGGDLAAVGVPRVFLAGVGPAMTEVAGEVADGFICHPFTTERYLREVTLPALERGRAKAGKDLAGFAISWIGFVVSGTDDEEAERAERAARMQLAFYASTPAYRPVLEKHGWGDLQPELNRLSKAGEWARMGELIDGQMLEALAIVATPEEIAPRLAARFGDVVSRVSLAVRSEPDADRWAGVIAAIKQL
jgi:probable F420-dependent oxidoreductase